MQSLFLVAIVIAFSSSIVFGDEVLKEALKSELKKPDQNSSEGINEVIQSINSSLISLKTRLSSLETKVGHVDEKPAGELSPATETRLGGNPAGDLSNNVKTIKQELANLTSEYNKVVGKVGGVNVIANDQLNETMNSTEVTTESSGIKSVTELLAGKLTTTLKSDEPAAQSLNTSSNTGANNQATTKSVPKVTLKTDDKPQQVESSTSKISDEPDSTTEIVQEETTISS